MRRIFVCLLAIFMIIGSFSSCAERADGEKPTVVCTSFVQYDWARQILGGNDAVTLRLLVGGGKDMHSFEPSAADMVAILESDLLIYTGGISEAWVDELAMRGELSRPLSLLDLLGENVKYADAEDAEHGHDEEGHAQSEIDEHVWLSLKNAMLFCGEITNALCEIDGENAALYRENCERYLAALSALDSEYTSLALEAEQKTLVVADRYPYRYLFEDYGITCHAAFSGCSSESEASFSTVIFLAERLDALGLDGILVTESADIRLAETVRANTQGKNAEILTLHSLQSVTAPASESYLDIMRSNLDVLKKVLN